ncbi:MAG: AAA family ATPase [candidate division SR1 bacterium]|nr:AAA family ATPase [candidate division SR1 bacterium]
MRYGNEESRTIIEKILNHHHDQEKPLFVLLVGESGLGKTSYLLQLLGEFLGPYRHQDLLWIRDCSKDLEKTHTLAVETPSSQKIIPLSNGENYENKGVREISTWLQQSAFSGKKCLLIENLERMSNAAMNAFLKTCEEPLKNRFIFATVSDESAILPTIFSRALVVRFSPLSISQMLDFLQNKTLINNQELIDMVVKMARGRSGLGLTFLKELEKDGDLAEFFVDGFSQFLHRILNI